MAPRQVDLQQAFDVLNQFYGPKAVERAKELAARLPSSEFAKSVVYLFEPPRDSADNVSSDPVDGEQPLKVR